LYCLDDARAVARLGECASSDSRAKLEGCRGFRLNGWQRIGIVLSVVWAIVGGLWGMKQAVAPAWRQFNACMSLPNVDVKVSEEIKNEDLAAIQPWSTAAIVGLVPIPIVWLIAYALVAIVRWIRAGFKTST
jgi:hypothetical protein